VVRSVAEGPVDLTSASGDIRLGIKQGSRLWIDARSMSGDVSSELELGDEVDTDEEGPLVEAQVTAMSGDIEVVRAP
jgi:Putative adhesin